jgi:hypothetical protein
MTTPRATSPASVRATRRAGITAACAAAAVAASCIGADGSRPAAGPPTADPTQAEVRLEAAEGWRASLVIDNGAVGVWTVEALDVFPQNACPEIVGLDDRGRCLVLVPYSGKWTPIVTIADGTWLGGLAQGDVDPRIPGSEVYTGAQSGNLYQVVAHREGRLDNRRIAVLPGLEIHTLAIAELDPARAGLELLAFTSPGGLWLAAPRTDGIDGFTVELLEPIVGRVRDALVLAGQGPGGSDALVTVSRSGQLSILRFEVGRPTWEIVHERAMGLGRVARRGGEGALVLYSCADDGLVLRHERGAGGAWKHEIAYAGPQGMRGIAWGRFEADPARETVAVFGYSAEVELLTRPADGHGPWDVRTIFTDRDRGHWLAAGEFDGRNSTDELIAGGYGGRIVLLSRPPGFGLGDVAHTER